MSLEPDDLDIPLDLDLDLDLELPGESDSESGSGSESESGSDEEPVAIVRTHNAPPNNVKIPIFKVFNMTKKTTVDFILVFYGFHLDARSEEELNDAFLSNPDDATFDFFSQAEKLLYLLQDPPPLVKFVNASLRVDDSVERVKIKIMHALDNKYAIEEMYLFTQKEITYHPISVYETLSQNEKQIPASNVLQFLSNIRYEVLEGPKKEVVDFPLSSSVNVITSAYKYSDIALLGIYDKTYIIENPVGQSFVMGDSEYPFAANPFQINANNKYSEQYFKSKLSILNGDLLLNAGSILNNAIYLCLVENVVEELGDDYSEYIIKMYYPMMAGMTPEEWAMQSRQQSVERVDASHTDKMQNVFDGVDMFYDVYQNSLKHPLKYSAHGIKEIKLTMRALFNTFQPLDTIFKLLHASMEAPLIKHTFSSRRDNVYRIYADKVTTDGIKVPHLNISAIHNISKTLSKVASVAVYIEYFIARATHSFICAFEENGDVSIYAKFNDSYLVSQEEFVDLLKKHVNPVLQMVKTQFEQSGAGTTIRLFEDIFSPDVDVVKATYKCIVNDTDKIDISKNIGCVSSAFNVETLKKTPAILRFKRVSNFNKLNSLEAFIIEKVNQDLPSEEIIESISQNFNISEQEATSEFASFMNSQQVSIDVKKHGAKIKANPGFSTSIEYKNKTIIVEVEGINNVQHLTTIPIYIDSMIRVAQPVIKTDYPLDKIHKICSGASKEGIGDTTAKITEVPVEIRDEPFLKKVESSSVSESPAQMVEEPAAEMNEVSLPQKETTQKIFGMDSEGEEEDEEPSEPEPEQEPVLLKEVVVPLPPKQAPKKIFGMDSSGEEEEEDEEPEGKTSGGAKPKKEGKEVKEVKEVKEGKGPKEAPTTSASNSLISSIKLKNDNPFPQDRIKDRDPVLFESLQNSMNSKFKFSKTQNNFTSYSTMCASNIKRQPVILTKEELIELKKNPGALTGEWRGDKYVGDDVLEYGADPNNKNYYMCPRYWCLTTDKMITHEQVLAGECGGVDKIIPKGASTPGDKTIYQFYDPSEHGPADEKGQPKNYQQHYPSFLSKNKTNDGYCLPCCFKNFNTPSHIAIKSECLRNASEAPASSRIANESKQRKGEETGEKTVPVPGSVPVPMAPAKDKKKMHGNYIKGPEKFPLEFSRWGYLPIPIQKFFDEAGVVTNCQVSSSDSSMKKFTKCLLRRGVERSANQSFIACLASASQRLYEKNDKRETQPVLSIREFKNKMIAALTLDGFVRYQNGGLINKFAKNDPTFNADDPKYNDVSEPLLYTDYKKSRLYNKMVTKGETVGDGDTPEGAPRNKMLNKVVQSFLQFKAFLNNDETVIDYTYLWDFVCEKNHNLFPQFVHGLNLVILNVVENDVTNNVELVCPTNQQSNEVFNTHKNTLILMSKEGMFEPIYLLEDKDQNSFEIVTTFSTKNGLITKPLRTLFDTVISPMFDKCTPYPSIAASKQRVENIIVKRAIPLSTLLSRLNDLKYTVKYQVVNFQSKVIGVVARRNQIPDGEQAESYTGYIPCYPSSIHEIGYKYNVSSGAPTNYDFIFMDEHDKIWNTYDNTVAFLKRFSSTKNVHKRNLKKASIPCEPIVRVIDNGVVIGVLTETNQFVQISDPFVRAVSDKDDYGLKDMDETGYLIGDAVDLGASRPNVDEHTFASDAIDADRIEYIKRIKLEENFYNTFKNGVRSLMNKLENIKTKEEINQIVNNRNALYSIKIEQIVKWLTKIVKSKIQFTDMGPSEGVLNRIDQIISKRLSSARDVSSYEIGDEFEREILKIGDCILLENGDCGDEGAGFPGFCEKRKKKKGETGEKVSKKKGGDCVLILPTVNLVTNQPNNKERYFEKVADEMVRYSSAKDFFLSPRPYLGINLSGHNLRKNEILLLESAMKQYFAQLSRATKVQQDRGFSYDDATPIRSEYNYVNEDKTADELMKEVNEQTCLVEKVGKISSEIWNKCFRSDSAGVKFGEVVFQQTIQCTFELLFYILKSDEIENKTGKKKYNEVNKVKTLMQEEYKNGI